MKKNKKRIEIMVNRPTLSNETPSINANMNRDCSGIGRIATPKELAEYLHERFKLFVPK